MKKLYAIDSSGFVRRRREKKLKRRKKHKASILQEKGSPCYLCMKMRPHYEWKRAVHEHHRRIRKVRDYDKSVYKMYRKGQVRGNAAAMSAG